MKAVRTLAAASILETFLVFGSATTCIPDPRLRRSARLRMNRGLARILAQAIGLRIAAPTRGEPRRGSGRILLANHVSVLDAIAIAVLEDAVFVTSRDMAESFLIRWLATIGGAVFVERRNRDRRTEELAHLEALLREGRTVVLFPEATSTNGSEILRFRNGLLSCAHRVPGVEIVPVCLQYISVGGRPIDSENRDRIFLYGEMSVGEHLRRIFSNPVVEMEVQYFKPFPARDFATAAEIASHPEFLVRSVFRPVREIA